MDSKKGKKKLDMKLKNILYVLKPVGKLFIVDKNGNSLAKIDAGDINTIADELDDCEVIEIYPRDRKSTRLNSSHPSSSRMPSSA